MFGIVRSFQLLVNSSPGGKRVGGGRHLDGPVEQGQPALLVLTLKQEGTIFCQQLSRGWQGSQSPFVHSLSLVPTFLIPIEDGQTCIGFLQGRRQGQSLGIGLGCLFRAPISVVGTGERQVMAGVGRFESNGLLVVIQRGCALFTSQVYISQSAVEGSCIGLTFQGLGILLFCLIKFGPRFVEGRHSRQELRILPHISDALLEGF